MRKLFALFLAAILLSVSCAANTESLYSKMNVSYASLSTKARQQVECLAQNIYFEAGKEVYTGQLAVAFVTLRRVDSGHYPNSICGVVRQKTESTCQFSWWCEADKQRKATKYEYTANERQLYNQVRKVALTAYLNWEDMKDPTKGAEFYHNTSVKPGWKLRKTVQIGNHIFYKRS